MEQIPSVTLPQVPMFLCKSAMETLDIKFYRTYEDTLIVPEGIAKNGYRYQFNGMEVDNEVKGNGNSYTTEYRQYDPRLGRWLSIDPLFQNFPWQSPYVAFDNNPILLVDPNGLAAGNGNDDDSGLPKNMPENPNEGDMFKDDNGYLWEYMRNDEGGTEWARSGGSFDDLVVYPEEVKEGFRKDYERIQRNRTSIMGQFIGDGTAWQGAIPEGRSIFYDPLIDNPNHPMSASWTKARANHKALEDFVQMYIAIGTSPLGGGIGGVRSLVASIGLGATVNFGSQMYANQGNIGSVDWVGVGAGGLSGAFKSPWIGATVGGFVDAGFDYTTNTGRLKTPKDKEIGNMANDLFWGSLGNYGSASFAKHPRFFSTVGSTITTVPTTTINTITNHELGY
ncbi:MAG: hypothetical protein M9916_07375 [Crocinitomicaceae bacterium]|nr:hypothetical protein [Crocinitomicaceae bacterium]